MSIEIIRGSSRKPVASKELDDLMSSQKDLAGQLFIGYPIIGTPEGPHLIDALLVTADKGLVLFDLIEGTDTKDYGLRQDDSANKLEARLKNHRELMRRRELRIAVHTISFAPGVSHPGRHDMPEYPLANASSLVQELKKFTWKGCSQDTYKQTLSVIESISTIRRSGSKRTITQQNSRGRKLKNLEDSIATLDNRQRRAVIETVEGVQRIRGLAGSGKTVVLALKAAYLHAQHPEWRIGVTFNTRSLKEHFRRLIDKFTLEQTGEEPDWENLRIISAWGVPGSRDRDGIYYQFCHAHDIAYFDFGAAKRSFGQKRAFAGACEKALNQAGQSKQLYDALLVDEAQDFSPAFLRLCYELLSDAKRLVYAYDELQSLSGESLPSPEEIFGTKSDGSPNVRFNGEGRNEPKQDVILPICYRNSRPVLVTAHALGFGIYRKPEPPSESGLIQMFDHPQLWQEIGYRRREGELREGGFVTLFRSEETSPRFLEDHSQIDDLIQFVVFENEEKQAQWLAEAIKRNLEEDELRHDDIVVVNPDPLTTRQNVGLIRGRLLDFGISSHLAGVDTGPDTFFQPDMASVTFTGVHRAKGNEAGMVYIINAQDCDGTAWNLARRRNRLFTAVTRSKSWVRVLGIGSGMQTIRREFEELKSQNFELRFTYPTQEQREHLQIVHRDMTSGERIRLQSRRKGLNDLVTDLESGSVHVEDLDKQTIEKLRLLLAQKD